MNKKQLIESLNFFINNDQLGITVYCLLKKDESFMPKALDIKDNDVASLTQLFTTSISQNLLHKEELSVLPLSSSDERKNVIYEYDLEIPEELKSLDTILSTDNIPKFSFQTDDFLDIKALLIEIGNNENQIVLYKTMAPINIFGRKSFFLKQVLSNERFEKINEDFIRISSGFQLLKVNNSLFVIDLETIEKFFGFHDIIKKEATQSLDVIEQIKLLENPETLKELIEDVTFARKLTKVAKNSPVIKTGIPNKDIIGFTLTHPAVKGKLRYNQTKDKIQLDTKVSKNLFVKLLNDDFLTSELTKLYYDSLAKDGVSEEQSTNDIN
ncbi:anti-phage protein KwaB [Roseivirga sp.]|uniref:anti-phage protein KwaB n=1 Tax=Roseivirga sp. TaxID=1964215 RepID=UPI003B8CA2EC